MQALQLCAPNDLREVELPVPQPDPDELLVQTVATTICTSDLNDIEQNPFGIRLPRVLGHEGAGIVRGLGARIRDFQLCDRVTAHPVIPCQQCGNCRRGLEHLCSKMGHLGLDRDGTFAEYFCIRADRARPLPDGIPWEFASLLEPVAVCLEAVERARIQGGDSVLIVGDGPFGIMMARLALARRPRRLFLVGRHDFRLNQVPEAITLKEKSTPHLLEAMHQANGGEGLDVALLAVGTASALDLCLQSLRARGRAVVFSAIHRPATVDLFRVHTHELEIVGACNDQNLIDPALACLGDPTLNLGSVVTHQLPFNQWPRAFELARDRKEETLKVALRFA